MVLCRGSPTGPRVRNEVTGHAWLDAYIPEGAVLPSAERDLLAKITDLLLEHEGVASSPARSRTAGANTPRPGVPRQAQSVSACSSSSRASSTEKGCIVPVPRNGRYHRQAGRGHCTTGWRPREHSRRAPTCAAKPPRRIRVARYASGLVGAGSGGGVTALMQRWPIASSSSPAARVQAVLLAGKRVFRP